jgi:hypothetical protein
VHRVPQYEIIRDQSDKGYKGAVSSTKEGAWTILYSTCTTDDNKTYILPNSITYSVTTV